MGVWDWHRHEWAWSGLYTSDTYQLANQMNEADHNDHHNNYDEGEID